MYKNIIETALKGVAVAAGVAVIVMSTLNTLNTNAGITMLAVGLTALALVSLQKEKGLS